MLSRVDWAAEGLLDGVEGDARTARAALLDELHASGIPLDELRGAVAEQRLVLLPVERALGGEPRHTQEEIAEAVRLPAETLTRTRKAFGLPAPDPTARVLTDEDLELAQHLAGVLAVGFPPEQLLDLARVLGRSMAQTAAALRTMVGQAFLRAGDDELEFAHRLSAGAEGMLPALAPTLERMFRLHLLQLLRSDSIDELQRQTGRLDNAYEVTVAFCDLVGFTRLGGASGATELGRVAGRLEELAAARIEAPLRFVKSLGDGILLAGPEAGAVIDVALGLVEDAEREGDEFPALRAGVAAGEAIERDGDLYGHPVNLASRLCDVARPASVLVEDVAREQAGEEAYEWSFAGERRLKGVGETKQFRARRRGEKAGDDGGD